MKRMMAWTGLMVAGLIGMAAGDAAAQEQAAPPSAVGPAAPTSQPMLGAPIDPLLGVPFAPFLGMPFQPSWGPYPMILGTSMRNGRAPGMAQVPTMGYPPIDPAFGMPPFPPGFGYPPIVPAYGAQAGFPAMMPAPYTTVVYVIPSGMMPTGGMPMMASAQAGTGGATPPAPIVCMVEPSNPRALGADATGAKVAVLASTASDCSALNGTVAPPAR